MGGTEHSERRQLPSGAGGAGRLLGGEPAGDVASLELSMSELLFRIGLLLAAGFFLCEGMGWPWQRSAWALVASVPGVILMVMCLLFQLRILGDWRRRSQMPVLVTLGLVLVVPLSGLLSPNLSVSALPEPMRELLTSAARTVGSLWLLGGVAGFLLWGAILSAYLLLLAMLVLTRGAFQRGIAGAMGILALFLGLLLYPVAETAVGFALLAWFFWVQFERPLLVPDRLRPHLSARQIDTLTALDWDGSLSTGETKAYLAHDAAAFGQMLDCGLVEFDPLTRLVLPGPRLRHDATSGALEEFLRTGRRWGWLAVGGLYILLPDFVPGPIDDVLVMFLCAGAGFDWFKGRKRGEKGF